MLARWADSGSDQQRAELIAVQPDRVRFVIQPGTAHVGGWSVIEQFFLDRVPAELGDGAQAAGDGGPGAAAGFQISGEALNAGAAGLEQLQLTSGAPAGEPPQVQLIRLPGQAAVPSQEPC
jgi:hypothetical protein